MGLVVLGLGVLLGGCPKPQPIVTPPPLRALPEAIAAVNNNIRSLSRALYCNPINVTAEFSDKGGRRRRMDLTGKLLFLPPRCFYLDLAQGLAGSVMRLGSNDEKFWVWVKPEENRLWWGRWSDVADSDAEDVLLRPDVLLAAMGLAPLPGPESGLLGPVRQVTDEYDKLLYLRGPDQRLWVEREYWLDLWPPHQVRRVVFRGWDGQAYMVATLEDYKQIGGTRMYLARSVRIEWPKRGDWLAMRLSRVRFKDVSPGSAAFRLDVARCPIPESRWVRIGALSAEPEPAGLGPGAGDYD